VNFFREGFAKLDMGNSASEGGSFVGGKEIRHVSQIGERFSRHHQELEPLLPRSTKKKRKKERYEEEKQVLFHVELLREKASWPSLKDHTGGHTSYLTPVGGENHPSY